MRTGCLLFFSFLLPSLAGAADCGSLGQLRWLLGEWVADGDKKAFHESWAELGPEAFEGAGLERDKGSGRLATSESLRLLQMADGVYYLSKVSHNELPVAFRLTTCQGGQFVFENAAHDFPRRIEYRHEGDDRLNVRVSDGGDKGFTLAFRRTAPPLNGDASVLAAEDARFAAMVAADPGAMRRWFAEDLEYVHSSGQVENRDQLIDSIVSGKFRYLAVTPLERGVVRMDRGGALVRGRGRFRVATGGQTLNLTIRYLAAYARSGGEWKLIGWQSLRVEAPNQS